MLRESRPGKVPYDLDSSVKTIFDALRMAKEPQELGQGTSSGLQKPETGKDPFYVLLEEDNLITHVSVATDTLLEAVPDTTTDDACRLVISVTMSPYVIYMQNLSYSSKY